MPTHKNLMIAYEMGFKAGVLLLTGKEAPQCRYMYPSEGAEMWDAGLKICLAINGPIYVEGVKHCELAWRDGQRVWGE